MERGGTFHQNTEQMETREKHIQQRMLEKVSKRGAFLAPFRAHWDVDAETLGLDTGDYDNNTHNDIYKLCDSVQFSSVQLLSHFCLCNPMDCSTPGLPVHHQLSEFTQTHVHCVDDAIQPSRPLSPPSPPAFNLSQRQGLFQWISSSYQVTKVLEL